MTFVLDSSVALAWILPDESNPAADVLADHLAYTAALVPSIWSLEIGNVLLVALRRGRISRDDRDRLVKELRDLPVEVDVASTERVLVETLGLADRYDLSTYDAAYLELAQRRGLPLATLDKRLREACAAAGIGVLPEQV